MSAKSDPYRSCSITVEGPRADLLVDQAIARAAMFLGELPHNLYADHVGHAMPVEYSRFQQHLGITPPAITWSATVTVKLLKEVVDARRERIQGPQRRHLRPVENPTPPVT